GGALNIARQHGEMAAGLRYLLQCHVEPVLLEDAGLLGERERRKAGPAAIAERDAGLGRCGRGKASCESNRSGENHGLFHGSSPHSDYEGLVVQPPQTLSTVASMALRGGICLPGEVL